MDPLERKVREDVEDVTDFACTRENEVGQSGNVWEIDAVIIGPGGRRLAYIEVKDTWQDANQSTYINHMRRAYARMGDFRHLNLKKAVVVGDRRDFGHKDWRALFDSIGCELVSYEELEEFLQSVVAEEV